MTERYLLCYAARYSFLVEADTVLHIWERSDAPPAELSDTAPIEMSRVLGNGAQTGGVAVGLKTQAGAKILIVDKVGGFSHAAEADFIALPPVFDFARKIFDAACSRAIAGAHPLRLRTDARLSGD
jgi:hypothetical protein